MDQSENLHDFNILPSQKSLPGSLKGMAASLVLDSHFNATSRVEDELPALSFFRGRVFFQQTTSTKKKHFVSFYEAIHLGKTLGPQ